MNCLTSDLRVTRSSSSRVDLSIFNEANFIVNKRPASLVAEIQFQPHSINTISVMRHRFP